MPKSDPDYAGAREWAKGYADWIKPRMAELKDFPYETEALLIPLGDERTGYYVTGIGMQRDDLVGAKDPHAFDVMRRIIAKDKKLGRPIPEEWKDFEREDALGNLRRPSKRGRPKESMRDLLFALMAIRLDGFSSSFAMKTAKNWWKSWRRASASHLSM